MTKLDVKALREMTGGKITGNEDGKDKKLDVLELQKMKLEQAQWNALAGGGKEDEPDAIDKLTEKMYNDLRRQQLIKELRGNSDDDNPTIKNLQKALEDMQRKYEESEKRRQEEERQRKIDERFERIEKLILESTTKKKNGDDDENNTLTIMLKEIEKMREEDRKEREKMRQEEEREKQRTQQIEDLRDEMTEHRRRLEDMIRDGVRKKDQGFIAELKQFKETQETLDKLLGKKHEGEDTTSVADTLDEITDKAPKVVQSIRSIYDMAKGSKEEDVDIGPMETMTEEVTQGRTAQPAAKSQIEKYVDEGYEIDDPDHPGKKMFVGLYKDYYVDQDGVPLSKSAVQLIAKTNPQAIEKTMQEAREQYFREQAQIKKSIQSTQSEQKPAVETPKPSEENETKSETKNEPVETEDQVTDEDEKVSEEDLGDVNEQ